MGGAAGGAVGASLVNGRWMGIWPVARPVGRWVDGTFSDSQLAARCLPVRSCVTRWHGDSNRDVHKTLSQKTETANLRRDYTIGTLDVLQAGDACADMGMAYSVIVQCADCVVFPSAADRLLCYAVRAAALVQDVFVCYYSPSTKERLHNRHTAL